MVEEPSQMANVYLNVIEQHLNTKAYPLHSVICVCSNFFLFLNSEELFLLESTSFYFYSQGSHNPLFK